uniref:RNA exonuclease 1 homolog isoform X2 n=1 Tax=Pristiophorus japonicus TaxID=55135 RepID=UPI00398F1206
MLRSTEFFRSIECPFYGGGGSCNRPYCHFRHRSQKPREKPPAHGQPLTADREHGYDPYNPELPKGSSRNGDGTSDDLTESSTSTLELELVNKAIEAVKNEVEREQKKLSRYEDFLDAEEEYVPSPPSTQKAISKTKSCPELLPNQDKLTNSLEYNPDSYHLTSSVEYTPTPLSVTACSSKYTLDTDDEADAKGNSLKYVPTLVTKPVKYTTSVPSNKYVIDNTKPCTDLEYDPLLNYSARLMSKKKSKEHGTKRPRENSYEEPYIPTAKKRCHRVNSSTYDVDMEFPDSGDELSNNYRQSRGGTSKFRNAVFGENKSDEGLSLKAKDLNKRSMKEIAVQYDVEDVCSFESKQQENRGKHKLKSTSHSSKISKCSKEELKERDCKEKKDKSSDLDGSKMKARKGKMDSTKSKSPHHTEKASKKGKIKCGKERLQIKREKQGVKLENKEKNGDNSIVEKKYKGGEKNEIKEEKQKIKSDGNSSRKMEKAKISKLDGVKNENRSKSRSNNSSDSVGKTKCHEVKIISTQKSDTHNSKSKTLMHRNGAHVGSKRKDKEIKESKSVKDKAKHPEKQKEKASLTKRSLSHTDLFGDDSSGDEGSSKPVAAVTYESDSDSDRDSYISSGSSNDEIRGKVEQMAFSSEDEIDFPGLEKDFEFESDPMEECLRIFNESKEVKNEDKGRVSKQVPMESNEEKESNLTTLFPGQKRRISHISKQENVEPAKPVIRPFRRLTAQEVCYQRSRIAQQQVAQLAAVETSVSTSFTKRAEKRRVAHKPNVEIMPSAKQSPVRQKMESLNRTLVLPNSPRNHSLSLKPQTTVGMASKTVSSTTQKRIAHAPTLKRKVAHNKKERTQTGGGLANLQHLTPLEERVTALMGPAWRKATTIAQAGPTFEGEEREANPDYAEDSDKDESKENIFQSHPSDQEHGGEGEGMEMDEAPTVLLTLVEVQVPPIEVPAHSVTTGLSVRKPWNVPTSEAEDSSGVVQRGMPRAPPSEAACSSGMVQRGTPRDSPSEAESPSDGVRATPMGRRGRRARPRSPERQDLTDVVQMIAMSEESIDLTKSLLDTISGDEVVGLSGEVTAISREMGMMSRTMSEGISESAETTLVTMREGMSQVADALSVNIREGMSEIVQTLSLNMREGMSQVVETVLLNMREGMLQVVETLSGRTRDDMLELAAAIREHAQTPRPLTESTVTPTPHCCLGPPQCHLLPSPPPPSPSSVAHYLRSWKE